MALAAGADKKARGRILVPDSCINLYFYKLFFFVKGETAAADAEDKSAAKRQAVTADACHSFNFSSTATLAGSRWIPIDSNVGAENND